jgi:hypothetical protein
MCSHIEDVANACIVRCALSSSRIARFALSSSRMLASLSHFLSQPEPGENGHRSQGASAPPPIEDGETLRSLYKGPERFLVGLPVHWTARGKAGEEHLVAAVTAHAQVLAIYDAPA